MKRYLNCVLVAVFLVVVFPAISWAPWGKIGSDLNITNDPSDSMNPSLVWTGAEYGLSWDDNMEIYFARLDSSGIQIGPTEQISDPMVGPPAMYPSLVWTFTEYGVSWWDNLVGNDVYHARLDSSGAKIAPETRITNDWTSFPSVSSLVWTGSGYGLSWEDAQDPDWDAFMISFTRLDSLGANIGPNIKLTDTSSLSKSPSLAWTGTEYGVSWHGNLDGNWEIYFARMDSNGNRIGGNIRITSDDLFDSEYPSLVWAGTEYGLSWQDYRDGNYEIYFARLDSTGAKIGGNVRITSDTFNSLRPSLVWKDSKYGLSWQDDRDGNYEIYFARLYSSGNKVEPEIRITYADFDSLCPSLVWSDTGYGVSWHDDRDGNYEIYFARIGGSDPILNVPMLSHWVMFLMAALLFLVIALRIKRQYMTEI